MLLWHCRGGKIVKVYGGIDSDGIALAKEALTSAEFFESKIVRRSKRIIEQTLADPAYVYHDYTAIEVWG